MGIRTTIKTVTLYYFPAGLVFTGLLVLGVVMDPGDALGYSILAFYVVMPATSMIIGFLCGGAKSYTKWGFPIFMAFLTFCLDIMVFSTESWLFIGLNFGLALLGVTFRHIINEVRRRRTK